MSAIQALPVRQRRALVMRELEGRTYGEIAAQLGASPGAVRQLLNRARSSVRGRLAALIPAELVLRWASLAGGAAPSGALTIAGGGAFAAKLSSAVLLSAMPVVAVNLVPGKVAATAHRRPAVVVRAKTRPAYHPALRPATRVVVPVTSRPVSAPVPLRTAAPRRRTATSPRPAGSAGSAPRDGGRRLASESGRRSPTMLSATRVVAGCERPGKPA